MAAATRLLSAHCADTAYAVVRPDEVHDDEPRWWVSRELAPLYERAAQYGHAADRPIGPPSLGEMRVIEPPGGPRPQEHAVLALVHRAPATRGHDGLARPGPADDVTGCPSDECQIQRQCTSATGCKRVESEVTALKRSYDEALAAHEATVEPLKRERDEALRRAEELAEARDAMQREAERFSLLVREARDEVDGQRAQIAGLRRQLDEDAEAKRRMLDWLEAIAHAAGSRFQDGPAVVGTIEAMKLEIAQLKMQRDAALARARKTKAWKPPARQRKAKRT